MTNPLAAVKRAASKRASSEAAYKQAIMDARSAGHTMPEIGQAAGISKQAVNYLLKPDPRKEQKT